jgi:salicylate hydroxylase
LAKHIAVIGAGIGGLTCALALAKLGFEVTVYEQAQSIKEVGAGLQLSPNAMHVIQQLGIAESLSSFAFRPQNAVMRHYKTGHTYFSVPLGEACVKQYGAEYWHVHRADLQNALYQACLQHNVLVQLNSSVSTYLHCEKDSRVELVFENAVSAKFELVIGADGIHSKVQETLLRNLGRSSKVKYTGQVAWRGTVKTKDLPANLVEPNANLWVGPGKHFVSYYLRGGELVNFVAVEERSNWHLESWSQEGDINQLRHLFNQWHPQVQDVLAASQNTFLWALHDREPLSGWVDKNVTLLGDACHPMLPFLAQGAAMAIEDAYVLATLLKKRLDIHLALLQYQKIRLPRTRLIQGNARKNASLYHMSNHFERAKLAVLSGLSGSGISGHLANKKLQSIYGLNVLK